MPLQITTNAELRREQFREHVLGAHGDVEMFQPIFGHEQHVGEKQKGGHGLAGGILRSLIKRRDEACSPPVDNQREGAA